jgi:hypothetical protein
MLDFGHRETVPMTEETTEQFLDRRERLLMSRVSALRGQLAPAETELAAIRQMRALLVEEKREVSELAKLIAANPPPPASFGQIAPPPGSFELLDQSVTGESFAGLLAASFAKRTIKDLVIQALIDAFPRGATTSELKDFMLAGYSRNVDPGSLRTQLHRLKGAGILAQNAAGDTWNFQNGQRALYMRYDHPTSRQGMSELQDEPTEPDSIDDNELLKRATELAWKDDDQTERASAERLEETRLHREATSDATAKFPWNEDGFAKEQASNPSPKPKPLGGIKRSF